MFASRANLKFFRNVCAVSFRRLGNLNVVNKRKYPFIVHTDNLFAKEDISRYNSRLPELVQSFCDDHADFKAPMERFATNISRVLPDRMLIEGLKIVELYKTISDSKSEEDIKNADILGWCSDILVYTIQMIDDIVEDNKVRWGKPSYYTFKDVGMYGVNDVVLFEHFSYYLVKKFFETKPWYQNCVDLLHDVSRKTAIAQSFETCCSDDGKIRFENMTFQNYKSYAIHEGAYPVSQMPVMMAHFAADNYDVAFPEQARNIIDEIGLYLTVQNDMVDYISDDVSAKGGITDISRGCITWMLIQALNRGSAGQKDILRKHYGVNNSDSVLQVIGVYDDLRMFDLYEQYKKDSLDYVIAETEKAPISNAYKHSILKMTEILY